MKTKNDLLDDLKKLVGPSHIEKAEKMREIFRDHVTLTRIIVQTWLDDERLNFEVSEGDGMAYVFKRRS